MVTRRVIGGTALPVAVALGAGLWGLWWRAGFPAGHFTPGLTGHGPDPLAWPRLLAVWVPTAHVLFTSAQVLLATWSRDVRCRWARWDQATLVLVPLLVGALLTVGPAGPWRVLIGGWYVAFVAVRTALLAAALWRWLAAGVASPGRAGAALFVTAAVPFLLLAAYVSTAISATGDEPYYLLIAHSLVHDRDTDLANNVAQRDYLPFYWGALDPAQQTRVGPDGALRARAYQGLQPALLAPGYWLAGRLGAMATMAVVSAATMALVFCLARRVGASPRAAFLAWLGATFSVPITSFAVSPFPEMSAALAATLAAAVLLEPPRGRLRWMAAAVSIAALPTLKNRYVFAAVPLALGLGRRVTAGGVAVAGLGLAGLVAVGVAYDAVVFAGQVRARLGALGAGGVAHWVLAWTVRAPFSHHGLLGSLFDQEYGVLLTAPVFLIGVAGMVLGVAEGRWRLLLLAGGPFILSWYYLGGLSTEVMGRAALPLVPWFGGFSPPARYLVAGLPLLAVFVALALDRVRGRMGWSVTAALYATTFGYAVILAVWPAWRFQRAVGRASVLAWAWERTGLDVGGLLPSFITTDADWMVTGLALVGVALVGGYGLGRRPGAPPDGMGIALGLLGLVGVAVGGLGYAAWRPWGAYPAVTWEGRGGLPFRGVLETATDAGTRTREQLVWAAQRDAVLRAAPRLSAGRYRVVVRVGAQGAAGPVLSVTVADGPAHDVELHALPPPVWREADYAYDVDWSGGRLPIQIELIGVSRAPPVRLAYVVGVEILPAGR